MIHPLLNFTMKGVLWYQGESNRGNPEMYDKWFPAMVQDWRRQWNLGDFPFFYVQIAPFNYVGVNSAFLRESQLKALEVIPNSGMAVTMDIGAADFIHPPNKKDVGSRLLYLSLHRVYGFDAIDDSGPIYESHEVQDSGILVTFSAAENGLYSFGELTGFEIAGKDQKFYPATASIVNRNKLFVKSSMVEKPVAVRYGWQNWVEGSLYDASLLPASSFRTDNWTDAQKEN
jgi:sialate O-acetylesterase